MTNFIKYCVINRSITLLLLIIASLQETKTWVLAAGSAIETETTSKLSKVGITNTFQKIEEHVLNEDRNLQQRLIVDGIALIDATQNIVLGSLTNGMTIVLSDYGLNDPNSLNFIATVSGGTVGSVMFTAFGNVTALTVDNSRHFAFCGNIGSNYRTCKNLAFGSTTLSAQPFSRRYASGTRGRRLTITFTIVDNVVSKSPTFAPMNPISVPTKNPTAAPTSAPIIIPTPSSAAPIIVSTPVNVPTKSPIGSPTTVPRQPTTAPRRPTTAPRQPTTSPRKPTTAPRQPTAAPAVPASAYDITLSLTGTGLTQSDFTTFQNAANRWKQVVVGDVPNIPSAGYSLPFSECTAPSVIDDLLICGKIAPIDGLGTILGYAGPTWIRGVTAIPFIGQMVFDSADVAGLRQQNTFYPVILHEMGHVMGIGTMWEKTGVTGLKSENCPYRGVNGNREYSTVSGCTGRALPTELDGGQGTRCGHFDEECFQDELMTGFATGAMPISRLTVATLQDLGYSVSYAMADPFTVANLNPSCVCTTRSLRQRDLKIVKPIETPGTSSSMTKRKLSDDGFQKALEFGKKILVRGRKRFHKDTNANSTVGATGFKQKNGQYIGGDFITVIYNDGINGIFGVIVTIDDLAT